ncbi:uncharacterized protein IUM83_01596 [Phytophthora cinnamomi]|uniref:uncharacterized protein n=1 Tax=Phytophthora cinnamomi TaxID=4785 RepID=UPI003559DF29|nr:hypothetical protein IUM83_01596 [Phytophthora cinnamomi]
MKLLIEWVSSSYLDFFHASNTAEVLERFRKKLMERQVRGCTIDDIAAQVLRLSEDTILLWSQPNDSGLSRMEILMRWLEANFAACLGAAKTAKLSMLKEPRDAIQRAGFPLCALRDLKGIISKLTVTEEQSIYLQVHLDRLNCILRSAQERPDEGSRVKSEPMAVDSQRSHGNSVSGANSQRRTARDLISPRALQVHQDNVVPVDESKNKNMEVDRPRGLKCKMEYQNRSGVTSEVKLE